MHISIQLYLCWQQTVEAVWPQLVEVPRNADFTTGQFWPPCLCVTNIMLTNNPRIVKRKRTFAIDLMSIDPPSHLRPCISSRNLLRPQGICLILVHVCIPV